MKEAESRKDIVSESKGKKKTRSLEEGDCEILGEPEAKKVKLEPEDNTDPLADPISKEPSPLGIGL